MCWLFGSARLISSEDDSLKDGVEGNSVVHLDHRGVHGYVQLSWDQDLNSGLVIHGDIGELLIPVGPLYDLFFRTPGKPWERVPCTADWPADLSQPTERRGRPRTYCECFDFQLIQVLRALIYDEGVPVDAQEGLTILELIEMAYTSATPLDQPWLTPKERQFVGEHHWHVGDGAIR